MTEIRSEKYEITLHKVLIIICCLKWAYDFNTSRPTVVTISDPQFDVLGPYNTRNYEVIDVYDELIDIKKFSFKVNPQTCRDYPQGLLLIIIVSSHPNNHDNRIQIRNTWGKTVDSTKIVFLIGDPENVTISQKIQNESILYGDIVQGNFVDAYRNMTYKHVMGLKWVAHHCPKAKYILKMDDDVVVNSHALRHFLARELSPWGASGLIACHVIWHAPAQRSQTSKWKVTTEEYAPLYYPTYCAGCAILYSQDVIHCLLSAAQSTPYFWIDDVHITGVLAEKIGVDRTRLNSLMLTQRKVALLKALGPKYVGPFLFGPPDMSVDRMSKVWRAFPKYIV